jgi:hypothetical protein
MPGAISRYYAELMSYMILFCRFKLCTWSCTMKGISCIKVSGTRPCHTHSLYLKLQFYSGTCNTCHAVMKYIRFHLSLLENVLLKYVDRAISGQDCVTDSDEETVKRLQNYCTSSPTSTSMRCENSWIFI